MFAKHLALISRELGGRSHVSVLLRCYLPPNVPYWPGRVVVCGSDSPVESFVVHPPLVGQVKFVLLLTFTTVITKNRDKPYP